MSFIPGTSHKNCRKFGRQYWVGAEECFLLFLGDFFFALLSIFFPDVEKGYDPRGCTIDTYLEAMDTENQGISVAISSIPKYQVPSVSCVRPITSQPLLLDAVRGFRLNNVWKLLFPCALVCVGKHENVRRRMGLRGQRFWFIFHVPRLGAK